MIDLLFQMILNNICISLVLAIMAAIAGITFKRPSITYLLWLLVFVKLLTPPFMAIPVIPVSWMDNTISQVDLNNTNEQPAMPSVRVSENEDNASVSTKNKSVRLIQGKQGLFLAWISGSMIVFLWSLLRVYRFNRLLGKESETAPPEIQLLAEEIASCLGLKTVPTIHATSAHMSPMVWWFGGKVWVVIPTALIEQMDAGRFRWILSHELAHVSRRDYMVRWIEWLACVCFWWNPVTWWARFNLRANEELCCDALVLSSMNPKPYVYGDSLLKAIEILTSPVHHPPMVASGINGGELLKRRVKMIISRELNRSNLHCLKACILLGALVVLPLRLTSAKGPDTFEPISKEGTVSDLYKSLPQDVMTKLEEQRKFPGLFLGEISQLIEKDVMWKIALKMYRDQMSMMGVAISHPIVVDFMEKLENSSLYKDVELMSIRVRQIENTEAVDFQINAMLDPYIDASLQVIPKELLPTFLPESRDIPSLLRQIAYFGSEAGLDIRHIILKKDIPKDGYFEIPFDMEVTGEYENIVTFFDAIRRMDRFVTLRDIKMQSVEHGSTIMKTSMMVVTYRM